MKVRAKFTVAKVSELGGYNGGRVEITRAVKTGQLTNHEKTGIPFREITMSAVYDGGSAENQSFAEATPTGSIVFTLNNAACADEFKPGDFYYVEFERAKK